MKATDRTLIQQDVPAVKAAQSGKVPRSRWAYILIGLGVFFLIEKIGFNTNGIWTAIGAWYPLVLIILGTDFLTRSYPWGRQLTLGLVVITALFMLIWSLNQPAIPQGFRQETVVEAIAATRAEIQLTTTVGRLEVSANNTGNLIDGKLELNGSDRLEREVSTRNGAQFVRLEAIMKGTNIGLPKFLNNRNSIWVVGLAPNIPLVLRIKTGVGSSRLNLRGLKVTDLSLGSGVGQTVVTLPALGRVTARVESGVGETNIFIPRGMESRVRVDNGIGAVQISGNYQRIGDVHTSSGFETASNRVELEIQGGIGRISVETER
jgi:hypothetical protein